MNFSETIVREMLKGNFSFSILIVNTLQFSVMILNLVLLLKQSKRKNG